MRYFYVSAIDGDRRYLIAGPYPLHSDALERVEKVRKMADERDPRASFMAWGTAGSDAIHKTPLDVV